MSRHVLAIRPEPGLSSTLKAAREIGLSITGAPLFEVRPLAWDLPDPAPIDALLIGSANAILHGGEQLSALSDKPVYAVGQATADAARDAGFEVAMVGAGGLQNVLDRIDVPLNLLRIAGAEHVALEPPAGITITTVIAYESVALPLDRKVIDHLGDDPVVLLHSAVAAQHFGDECDRIGIDRKQITLAALGPRIADAAGAGWRAIHVADLPNDAALLALARGLCI